jgi:CRP/FNR family transcriptional regulator, cyclic AMP receptor protein
MSVPKTSSAFVAEAELMEALEKLGRPAASGRGGVLFRQGDAPAGVYLVQQGTVTLETRSDGDAVLRVQVPAGSLLGVTAVVSAKPYTLTATVEEGAEVSMLSSKDFLHLLRTDPRLSFHVLRMLAEQVRFGREVLAHL